MLELADGMYTVDLEDEQLSLHEFTRSTWLTYGTRSLNVIG